MKLISIIMPAFNATDYIHEALNSIVNQTYTNWELLISDDASTDNTKEIIDNFASNYSQIKCFHNKVNEGYLRTWNNLMSKAKGDYITFLDADDSCSYNRISLLADQLNKNKDIWLIGSNINSVNANGRILNRREYPIKNEEIQANLLTDSFPFCGSAVMIRRIVYQNIGGYREYFNRLGWEDHDWLIRCCIKYKSMNFNEFLYNYRENNFSVTRYIHPNEYKKLIIKNIGKELAKQRIEKGTDFLEEGDYKSLRKLEERYENPFKNDPSLIYRIIAGRSPEKSQKIFWFKKAIGKNFLEPKNYYHLLKVVLRIGN